MVSMLCCLLSPSADFIHSICWFLSTPYADFHPLHMLILSLPPIPLLSSSTNNKKNNVVSSKCFPYPSSHHYHHFFSFLFSFTTSFYSPLFFFHSFFYQTLFYISHNTYYVPYLVLTLYVQSLPQPPVRNIDFSNLVLLICCCDLSKKLYLQRKGFISSSNICKVLLSVFFVLIPKWGVCNLH